MKTVLRKLILQIAGILLILFSIVYLYTLLHEGGHALVAIMYGGKIDNFVLGFNAHVTYSGVNFTQFGESLCNSAGVLLPTVILAIALIFYNRNIRNLIYHYIYALCTIMICSSFFAWVAIPLISLFTTTSAADDVTKFLRVSGLNPLLVSLISLILIFILELTAYKKGLYSKFVEIVANMKALSQAEDARSKKYQTVGLILVVIFLGTVGYVSYRMLMPAR